MTLRSLLDLPIRDGQITAVLDADKIAASLIPIRDNDDHWKRCAHDIVFGLVLYGGLARERPSAIVQNICTIVPDDARALLAGYSAMSIHPEIVRSMNRTTNRPPGEFGSLLSTIKMNVERVESLEDPGR